MDLAKRPHINNDIRQHFLSIGRFKPTPRFKFHTTKDKSRLPIQLVPKTWVHRVLRGEGRLVLFRLLYHRKKELVDLWRRQWRWYLWLEEHYSEDRLSCSINRTQGGSEWCCSSAQTTGKPGEANWWADRRHQRDGEGQGCEGAPPQPQGFENDTLYYSLVGSTRPFASRKSRARWFSPATTESTFLSCCNSSSRTNRRRSDGSTICRRIQRTYRHRCRTCSSRSLPIMFEPRYFKNWMMPTLIKSLQSVWMNRLIQRSASKWACIFASSTRRMTSLSDVWHWSRSRPSRSLIFSSGGDPRLHEDQSTWQVSRHCAMLWWRVKYVRRIQWPAAAHPGAWITQCHLRPLLWRRQWRLYSWLEKHYSWKAE